MIVGCTHRKTKISSLAGIVRIAGANSISAFSSNDSLGRPHLHSPSLACRVFLIKKPYSSKLALKPFARLLRGRAAFRLTPSMLATPLMHQGWGAAVLPWVAFYGLVHGTAWVLGPLLLPHCRMAKVRPLAVPQLGSRHSSGHTCWRRAARCSQGERSAHWAPSLGFGCSSEPPPKPPISSPDHVGTAASWTRLAVRTGPLPS